MKKPGARRAFILKGALLFALLCAGPGTSRAHAQMRVIDPANLAQNLVQAQRALEQTKNQIRQIEQQAQMLAGLDLQLSPEISASIAAARALFDEAQGLAFESERLADELRSLYPRTYDDYDVGAVIAQSRRWMSESRASLETAMRAEAEAALAVGQAQGRIEAALSASAAAEGQTGAAQAGNQLLGVTAAQLVHIEALLAAEGRALAVERMERLARQERASALRRGAFPQRPRQAPDPARSAF